MLQGTFEWLVAQDLRVGLACNRAAGSVGVAFFRVAGRVGDGHVWVALALALAAFGQLGASLRLLGALVTCTLVYRVIKMGTARPRPYVVCPDIRLLAAPLDRYSFPSGHTLHAVATALVVSDAAPGSGPLLGLLAAAIAASRVVLGLHWPSDVVAGAVVGLVIGLGWSG